MSEHEQAARHEAGHVAAALVLGVPVLGVSVTPETVVTPCGLWRQHGYTITGRADPIQRMIVTLAGPLEGAETWDEVPRWPPVADEIESDEGVLARIVHDHRLTERDFREAFRLALEVTLGSEYQRLITAITGLLDFRPRFGAAELAALDAGTRGW